MSWALASFVALGVALAFGFAWYERSRPSARLLAVVGTLAALAILGRIAFAPVPNVKPTTDIVLIAGYALGGAPGFAVGAVAALGSNLFFGQGPWTPWQMSAWGLVGLFGAGLARAFGGRRPTASGGVCPGRVPLALACGLAGLAYGAILDFSTWVTFTGEHTLGQYLAISGTALPFNLAHAIGNVVFFLAFGPGLIAAVQRCRTRFAVVWQRAPGAALPAVLLALVIGAAALAPAGTARAAEDPAAARALSYLEGARNADGGWGAAPGQASDGLHTAWAAYALAASGVRPDAHSPPASALLVTRLGRSRNIGDVERTILGLLACGGNPRDAGGRDLVAELLARRRKDGSFGGYVSYSSYAILALKAAGEQRGIAAAARWIAKQANRDGGFNVFRRGSASNADDSSGAIQALIAAGRRSTNTVRNAIRYLRRAQHRDGGYSLSAGAPTNAQSTAFATLALVASKIDPESVTRNNRSPLDYIRALQRKDGSVSYSRSSRQTPVWVTAQALLALRRQTLPVLAPPTGPAASTTRATRAGGAVRRRIGPRAARSKRTDGDRTRSPRGSQHEPPALATPVRAHTAGAALALLFDGLLRT